VTALPDGDDLTVAEIEVRLVDLVLRRLHRAAHGAVRERPTVIVRAVLEDGSEGWGECPALPAPTYTGEHAAGSFAVLVDHLAPALVAGRPSGVVGHPMAAGALDDAVLDAALRREGRSLATALGATRSVVPRRTVVSGDGIDDLLGAIEAAVAGGATRLGLKVGPDRLEDPVDAVRATWPALGLAIDGNGSLGGVDDARWRRIDRAGLDEVEQPCRPGDWLGSARVAGCLGCPVVLDESISGADDLRTAVVLGAARAVNLKPARVGGVRAAAHLATLASRAGLGVLVGGMLESGVGRAAALAVAALDACDRATHLGPSAAYWDDDLTPPLTGTGDEIAVPGGPGTGAAPLAARLDAATRERAVIAAP
jgi:O-succinylbenzoate synthase